MSPRKAQDADAPPEIEKKPAIKPAIYASLEEAKFCPRCGNQTAVQQPMLPANVLQCTRCWVKYKVELPPD